MDARAWIRPESAQGRPSRRALADWTLEQMYELLFSGQFASGDAISELEVAARLQVSRSPVRLAFQQLETDGLVVNDEKTGKKKFVTFGIEDIQELYTIRSVLEGLAHREAAGKTTPQDLEELQGLLEKMSEAPRTGKAGLDADFRFHEIICEASGMARAVAILRSMWLQTYALVRQLEAGKVYPDKIEMHRVHDDHAAILQALRVRDPVAAEQAAIRHLERARDSLLNAAAKEVEKLGSS
jgi:DNA-binding GntR family transcriptional regulator